MKKIRQLWTATSALALLSGCTKEKPAEETSLFQINDQYICLLDSEEQQLFERAMGDQTLYSPADLLGMREYGGITYASFLVYSETGSHNPRKAWTILTVRETAYGSVSSGSAVEIHPEDPAVINETLYDRSWTVTDKAGSFPDPDVQNSFEEALRPYPDLRAEPAALLCSVSDNGRTGYTALCRRITGEEITLCIVKWETGKEGTSAAEFQPFDLSYYAFPPVQ